ncbi:hypothetical protein AB3N02_21615 [Priestia aryabhattai]|uniref:hypothetical protein n=1 Tax=Priestia aryabhattai TaxID=412384 RepID=UPI00399FE051
MIFERKVNDTVFKVNVFSFMDMRKQVRGYLREFDEQIGEDEDNPYTELFTEHRPTRQEVSDDVESMEALLTAIEHNPAILDPYIEQMRKKKNGKFWANSIIFIDHMEFCCHFWTEYTSVWSTPELRLRAITESTCELVLETVQNKH